MTIYANKYIRKKNYAVKKMCELHVYKKNRENLEKKINRQQFLKIKKENEIRKFSVGFPKKRKKVTATKGRCYPAAKRPIQYDCKDSNKFILK